MCADKAGGSGGAGGAPKTPAHKQVAPALILKIALLGGKHTKDEEKRKKEVRADRH
jgi:hypothetical protein